MLFRSSIPQPSTSTLPMSSSTTIRFPCLRMHLRQHSPLLLQITSTNACEAWHRQLKQGGMSKEDVKRHGIYGMILNIIEYAHQRDSRPSPQLQIFAKTLFLHQRVSIDWTVPGADPETDRKATGTRQRPRSKSGAFATLHETVLSLPFWSRVPTTM